MEPLQLVDFIRAKERRERRRRYFLWGSLGAVVAGGLVGAAAYLWWPRGDDAYRVYAWESLTRSQVEVLLAQDPRPILVVDAAMDRTDTLRKPADYALLLAARADAQQKLATSEGEQVMPTDTSLAFVPAVARQPEAAPTPEAPGPLAQAELMPAFPGGEAALYTFLSGQLRYPAQAEAARVEGKVLVRFVVEADGALTNLEVLQGLGHGCDEEALRVLRLMPAWLPGEQGGQAVPVFVTLALNFRFL